MLENIFDFKAMYYFFQKLWISVRRVIAKSPFNGIIHDNRTLVVLSYPNLKNIGDEIQTLAITRLVRGRVPLQYVARENLRTHFSIFRRPIFLNGWFLHDLWQFPPAKSLDPKFIGFHLARPEMLDNPRVISYFMRQREIGCRDSDTVELLRDHGINANFSGCPTLTFDRLTPIDRGRSGSCLVVDAHLPNPDGHTSDVRDYLAFVIERYGIKNQRYLTQNCEGSLSAEAKFKLAERRLDELESASLVITNRLHVALPCLALCVPVIFLHRSPETDARLKDYLKHLWHMSENSVDMPNVEHYLEIQNKDSYLELRSRIRLQVERFLQSLYIRG